MAKVTPASEGAEVWPEKPVQLNRRTVAAIALSIIVSLGLGLQLGLRGLGSRAEPPEESQGRNLYTQAEPPADDRRDFTYQDATAEAAEPEPKTEASPPPARAYRPDPYAEQRRKEEEAARQSGLFPQGTQDLRQGFGAPAQVGANQALAGLDLSGLNLPSAQDLLPGGQTDAERRAAFLASGTSGDSYLPHRLQQPISAYEIKAGTVIPSALITGLNSDLPGEIVGQVNEHVYDTVSGNHLLIPQGTRIFGRYNADIAYGQDRAQIVWDRLILPNGASLRLDAMVGTDKAGQAGLSDQVDYHAGRLFGAVLLSSFITAGANLVADSDDNGFTEDLGDAAGQQAVTIGGEIVRRQLDVQPTITIRPGFKLNILVNRDMIFPEPYDG